MVIGIAAVDKGPLDGDLLQADMLSKSFIIAKGGGGGNGDGG